MRRQRSYKSKDLPIAQRVKFLIQEMTLEEKVGQMIQLPVDIHNKQNEALLERWHVGSFLHVTAEDAEKLQSRARSTRLGIPLLFGIDAIHGHCFEDGATVFPTQLGMSTSWNYKLIKQAALVTAEEMRACGLHWTFSPVLCVGRDLRWGRIDETFGEDPWLCGEFAKAMIEGYQRDGDFSHPKSVLACAKHYVAYGETLGGRDAYESDISKRKLLSLFLPPFERVIKEADCATLMTAYQAIDGTPCTINQWLLKDIPKQWGFDGFIVTDWENVQSLHRAQRVAKDEKESSLLAFDAGNHMVMTTEYYYQKILELVTEGRIKEDSINQQITPILTMKFKLGLFDRPLGVVKDYKTQLGTPESWSIGKELAREAIVLLKNNNQTLPLHSKEKILLTGPNANSFIAQLGDWSFGSSQAEFENPLFHRKEFVSCLDGLKQVLGDDNVLYHPGCDVMDSKEESIEEVVRMSDSADTIIAVIGDTKNQHGEGLDRANLDLSGSQQQLLEALHITGKKLVVVFLSSKPLAIAWVKEHADAVICAFNPGSKGGEALAEILVGKVNPSGKLTISFPYHVGQLPVYYNSYPGWHSGGHFGKDLGYCDTPNESLFAFGEGLSYTTFTYEKITVKNSRVGKGDSLNFSVTLRNSGNRAGKEVIQVYIRDLYASVTTPIKELKGYTKIFLEVGESREVYFSLPYESFSLVNAQLERVVEPGDFTLFVGASSLDKDLLSTQISVC